MESKRGGEKVPIAGLSGPMPALPIPAAKTANPPPDKQKSLAVRPRPTPTQALGSAANSLTTSLHRQKQELTIYIFALGHVIL